jgi:hypothetical protein
MRGGALAVSGVEGGHREAARVRAFEAAVAAPAVWPGEEDDQAGRASWAGQRARSSGGWWQRPNGRAKGSGPARVEGEAGRGWAESRARPEFKKIFF